METEYVPFCGVPPVPGELMMRWTLDPVLLLFLAILFVPVAAARNGARAGALGWAFTALLFISPICALSMSLFSARVAQHLLLTLVAAPLLMRLLPRLPVGPLPAAVLFGALFWSWHAPVPYAATLASDVVYWAMHLSLLGGATLFWSAASHAVSKRPLAAFLGVAITAAQMTGLAVLLIFSATPWHDWHELTAAPWGLSTLDDQVLAGALMWVAGAFLMTVSVWRLVRSFFDGSDGGTTEMARTFALNDRAAPHAAERMP